MFALRDGKVSELHGIQVGVGTVLTLDILARLRAMQPDPQTAAQAADAFDTAAWEAGMRRVFWRGGTGIDRQGKHHMA